MRSLKGLATMLIAGLGACCWAEPALASGGANIASAPMVAYGSQEFGNTATDYGSQTRTGALDGDSWWQLQATASDRITIDWEGDADWLEVWPVGTTDYNVNQMQVGYEHSPFISSNNSSNGKMQTVFTVPRDGAYPLEFQTDYPECGCGFSPGPYDFTAYVQHALVVSLSVASVNRRHHYTSFRVGLHNPDGAAISNPSLRYDVQHRAGGSWRTTATFGPLIGFRYTWARGQRGISQYIRVQVHGPGYLTTTSGAVRVTGV